uniref:Uncharacterized protein n=1 Tax=Rhizophora mucronata TaxID=61149 RepID=A0A2P2L042_RHIMU
MLLFMINHTIWRGKVFPGSLLICIQFLANSTKNVLNLTREAMISALFYFHPYG